VQIDAPLFEEILTDGVIVAFIVMVMPVLVADDGEAQAALLVISQVTVWPLVNVLVVYVALLVPTLLPFTFHW